MQERFGINLYKQNFHFASAHFLIFADGTREELHGHNYITRIQIDGPIQKSDVVIDFMVVKPIIRECCAELDHKVILPLEAKSLRITQSGQDLEVQASDGSRFLFPAQDCVLLPIPNTSTERLAQLLARRMLERMQKRLPDILMTRIRVEVEESGGQSGWFELVLQEL